MSSFSLADLCELADVTPRTVRFYIVQGLLRPASGAGPAARYDDGHLYRLRLIRRLQKEHLPLVEIRRRLDALTDPEVERFATETASPTDTAADYVSRVLGTRGITAEPSLALPSRLPPSLASMAAPEPPAKGTEPVRSQWERIALAPDIELHLRRPLSRPQNRRVDRLLEAARSIFKEEDE